MGRLEEPKWVDYPDDTMQELYCGHCDGYEWCNVSWDNQGGIGTCPVCGDEIEVEPPEADYEAMVEREMDARAHDMFREP